MDEWADREAHSRRRLKVAVSSATCDSDLKIAKAYSADRDQAFACAHRSSFSAWTQTIISSSEPCVFASSMAA